MTLSAPDIKQRVHIFKFPPFRPSTQENRGYNNKARKYPKYSSECPFAFILSIFESKIITILSILQ